jgi:dethiobiotin synthetase
MSYFITGTDTGVGKTMSAPCCMGLRRWVRVAVSNDCCRMRYNGHHPDAVALRAASAMPLTYGQ